MPKKRIPTPSANFKVKPARVERPYEVYHFKLPKKGKNTRKANRKSKIKKSMVLQMPEEHRNPHETFAPELEENETVNEEKSMLDRLTSSDNGFVYGNDTIRYWDIDIFRKDDYHNS